MDRSVSKKVSKEEKEKQLKERQKERREKASYYAVIPSHVRYCDDLLAQEKLLYGEITALTNTYGYCFASNTHFAELYGVSKRTISRQISKLEQFNFIKIEIIRDSDTKEILERRIYLNYVFNASPIDTGVYTPIDTDVYTPIDTDVYYNTTSKNNTSINKTTTTPVEKKSEKKEDADAVVVVDTYAINELILKYLKPTQTLTSTHLKKIGRAKGFTFERLEKVLQVAKLSNIRSLVGWLIKAIENPDFDFTTVETKAVADSAAKSKIVNYKGRDWDYKRLAELTEEYLTESISREEGD